LKLTPLDIKKQEFKKMLRGFDPVEVQAFLEMISSEYEVLIRERNQLSDEVLKLKTQLKDYQQVERTFKESLMKAQQTIDQSRENAKHEAELIIREAELKAEKILESTRIQLADMKNELILIKSQKDSFAKRLKHLLESQLELIGVLEIDDIGLGQLDENTPPPPQNTSSKKTKDRTELEFTAVDEEEEEGGIFGSKQKKDIDFQYSKENLKASYHPNDQEMDFPDDIETEKALKNDRRRVKLSDQFII